jgi:hypothetical protein
MKKEEEDHLVSSLNGIMLRKIGHNKCPEMYIQMGTILTLSTKMMGDKIKIAIVQKSLT